MFKAFTDNLSSLLGVGDRKSTDSATENGSVEIVKDEQTPSSSESSEVAVDKQVLNSEGVHVEASISNNELKNDRAPPSRPKPPSWSASFDSQTTSLSESETPRVEDAKDNESLSTVDREGSETKLDRIDEKLDEMAERAKQWGSYLFSITKQAGASVTAKAKELKKVVAENTILADFAREQDKFLNAKKEQTQNSEAAVPPWVGYNEEEQMKAQMLSLSSDKRNFLRNPPAGIQFHFDYDTCYPVAMATLAEDEKLQKMRFDLVPKSVSEHDFWRNYFYRVSLIKQSTQLSALAKQSAIITADKERNSSVERMGPATSPGKKANSELSASAGEDIATDEISELSPPEEFVSDAYNLEISDEDLMKEMQALRASPEAEAEWERELQKELNEYEVVGDSVDEAALEREVLAELELSESKK